MRRRLTGIARARASIKQIDLATRGRILDEIGRGRTEGDVASIGTHRGRVAVFIRRSAVSSHGEHGGARLAS